MVIGHGFGKWTEGAGGVLLLLFLRKKAGNIHKKSRIMPTPPPNPSLDIHINSFSKIPCLFPLYCMFLLFLLFRVSFWGGVASRKGGGCIKATWRRKEGIEWWGVKKRGERGLGGAGEV